MRVVRRCRPTVILSVLNMMNLTVEGAHVNPVSWVFPGLFLARTLTTSSATFHILYHVPTVRRGHLTLSNHL